MSLKERLASINEARVKKSRGAKNPPHAYNSLATVRSKNDLSHLQDRGDSHVLIEGNGQEKQLNSARSLQVAGSQAGLEGTE